MHGTFAITSPVAGLWTCHNKMTMVCQNRHSCGRINEINEQRVEGEREREREREETQTVNK